MLVSLVLMYQSAALRDACRVSYGTRVVRRCLGTIKPCCKFSPPCSFNHTMSGVWKTELDVVRTPEECEKQCNRHLFKCGEKCQSVSETGEVRTSKTCKCVRDFPGAVINQQCLNACVVGNMACKTNCLTGKRCPLRATTRVFYNRNYLGTCAAICYRPPSVPTRPPTCLSTQQRILLGVDREDKI